MITNIFRANKLAIIQIIKMINKHILINFKTLNNFLI